MIGSDVIYYEEDAEVVPVPQSSSAPADGAQALTAAIVKHLRAGGTFFLMYDYLYQQIGGVVSQLLLMLAQEQERSTRVVCCEADRVIAGVG